MAVDKILMVCVAAICPSTLEQEIHVQLISYVMKILSHNLNLSCVQAPQKGLCHSYQRGFECGHVRFTLLLVCAQIASIHPRLTSSIYSTRQQHITIYMSWNGAAQISISS